MKRKLTLLEYVQQLSVVEAARVWADLVNSKWPKDLPVEYKDERFEGYEFRSGFSAPLMEHIEDRLSGGSDWQPAKEFDVCMYDVLQFELFRIAEGRPPLVSA